jgi:hypothetical protein
VGDGEAAPPGQFPGGAWGTREHIIQPGDHAIAAHEFVIARQPIEDRHIPLDQIVGFLDDRQLLPGTETG